MTGMRYLGVDAGTARIGIALSDDTGTIASPYGFVSTRIGIDGVLQEIRTICDAHQVGTIVIGMPLSMSGEARGESARLARKLGEALEEALELEVVYVDERFTTTQAERALIGANVRRKKRKQVVDKVAAALILQSYLDGRSDNEP